MAITATQTAAQDVHGGTAMLDELRIKREPRGQLGRFFLDAEARLAEHGITLRRADFASLLKLHLANKASWRSPLASGREVRARAASAGGSIARSASATPQRYWRAIHSARAS